MSERITTTTNKRIGYMMFDLSDGETSATVALNVRPAINYFLSADPVDVDFEVQARETGSGDPFVDIGSSPIDLSSYTPETPVSFDFRVIASSPLTDVRRVLVNLVVSSAAAVMW